MMHDLLRTRLPVWRALSEFFLDTELGEADYQRIAAALGNSPYTEQQLGEILRYEVYPPCRWNLMIATGEWLAFSDEWLLANVARRCDKRPRFPWPIWFADAFMPHWRRVRVILNEMRREDGTLGKLSGSTNRR